MQEQKSKVLVAKDSDIYLIDDEGNSQLQVVDPRYMSVTITVMLCWNIVAVICIVFIETGRKPRSFVVY